MIQLLLTHKKTNKRLILFEGRDFETQNPIEQYGNKIIVRQMILNGVPKEEINGKKEFTTVSLKTFRNALEHWLKLKEEFQKIKVPENLIQLLKTDSKINQEKLLEGFILSPKILTTFIFTAYHKFGYTLSQYTSAYSQKKFNTIKILSAKILDSGKHRHCFFTTFNRLKDEKTQLYYISSAFGINRSELVKQIKSSEPYFNLDNLPHISL